MPPGPAPRRPPAERGARLPDATTVAHSPQSPLQRPCAATPLTSVEAGRWSVQSAECSASGLQTAGADGGRDSRSRHRGVGSGLGFSITCRAACLPLSAFRISGFIYAAHRARLRGPASYILYMLQTTRPLTRDQKEKHTQYWIKYILKSRTPRTATAQQKNMHSY